MERTVCTTPLTVYVRVDGNDNNDGLSVASAKKTVASARDVLLAVDGRGHNPIIDIGPGTFESEQISFSPWHNSVNQRIHLRGAGKDSTILKNANGTLIVSYGAFLNISEMNLQGGLRSTECGTINLVDNIALGPVSDVTRHLEAHRGGNIYINTATCDVYGNARAFLYASGMAGGVDVGTASINFVDNPAFSYAVCECYGNGTIAWSTSRTYTGVATGKRFIADTGGTINCGTGNPNSFLPGTIDGEIRTHGIVGGQTSAVPLTRNINTREPLNGGGVLSADLTLGLNASSNPTANYVIQRDASGRARVAAPAAAADIARKAEVDAVEAKVTDVDTKVDALDAAVITVDGKVDSVDVKVSAVDAKVDTVEAKIPVLSDAVDSSSSITAASSGAVKTAYDKAVEAENGSVPATRNIVTSAPLSGGGTLNADLSLSVNASSTSIANYVIQRDAYGRARVGAPVSANDIARKADVDAVDVKVDTVDTRVSTLDSKVGVVEAKIPALSDVVDSSSSIVAASSNAVKTAYDKAVAAGTASVPTTRSIATSAPLSGGGVLSGNLTLGINASSAVTANYVIQRDASGRAKVAAPSAADDIARKAEVDAVNSTLGIVNSKVEAVDAKVGAVDAKVGAVDAKVGAIDVKVGVIDGKVAAVDSRIPVLSDAVNSTSSIVAASSKAVKTAYDKAVASETASVPTVRTISTSAPLSGGGALSADLNLGLNASSTATANYVIQRDAGGRAQVAAPVAAADIARKADVDAAIAQIPALSDVVNSTSSVVAASSKAVKTAYDKAVNSEAVSVPTTRSISTTAPLNGGGALNSNLTLGLNASSAATPDYVIQRDANGRAKVAAPAAADDIARKAEVDAVGVRVGTVDAKVDVVDAKVDTLEVKVGVVEGKIPTLSDAVNSISSFVAASSRAVKTAYDKALEAVALYKTLRTPCTANFYLYVCTDGNDSNDGLSAATAKKTVQAAVDALSNYDGRGYTIFINVGPGIFESAPIKFNAYRRAVNAYVTLTGSGKGVTTLRSTESGIISNSGFNAVTVRDMSLEGYVYCECNGMVYLSGDMSIQATTAKDLLIQASRGGMIFINPNSLDVSGTAAGFLYSYYGGRIEIYRPTVNFVGNPVFSDAVCKSIYGDSSIIWKSLNTWTGTCTGKKYIVDGGGSINCHSTDPNLFLPGTVNGEILTNGVIGGQTSGRAACTGDLTLYVRTDGNDKNDGRSPATAKATLAALARALQDYDPRGYKIRIKLGAGTFNVQVFDIPGYNHRNLFLYGDFGQTFLAPDTGSQITLGDLSVNDITFRCGVTTLSGCTLRICGPANEERRVAFDCGTVETTALSAPAYSLINLDMATVKLAGNISFGLVADNGRISCSKSTKFIAVNTPSFSRCFAGAMRGGSIGFKEATFEGGAIGRQYEIYEGGMIAAQGNNSDLSKLLGDTPGTVITNAGNSGITGAAKGGGRVNAAGSMTHSFGTIIASASKSGTGVYKITLNQAVASSALIVTTETKGTKANASSDTRVVTVETTNVSGTPTDAIFSFVMF